jgi:ribonuclease P protein component
MGAAANPPGGGFPKSARLLRRSEFLSVRQLGRGFADGPLAASWVPRPAGQGPTRPIAAGMPPASARVGLTVSSKVGGSVVRNRIKRRLREAVRRELSGLPAVDLVLVARASSKGAGVDELRAWIRRAAARMTKEGAGR